MRKLMLLAAMLAMVLMFAAPAGAQTTQEIFQQCVGDVTGGAATQVTAQTTVQAQVAEFEDVDDIDDVTQAATQIVQQNPSIDQSQAIIAACEQNAANVSVTSFNFASFIKGLLSIF